MSESEESRRLNTEKRKKDSTRRYTDLNAPESNPCIKEQNLSFKCLSDNNYDRDACTIYFQNYRNCKEFWNTVTAERRAKGIKPHLPPPDERAKIKAESFRGT